MGNIAIKQFIAGSCYSYILSSNGGAVIIDAHISIPNAYKDYLRKNRLAVKAVIDTHTHADHFSLAAVLKKDLAAPLLMGEKAISDVVDRRLKEGDDISFGGASLKVLYTPGHTDDAVSLYGGGMLFTGDVLLIGSVGRTDFQNGSPESMFDTLQRLKALPPETHLYPGHDYHDKRSSTIGAELAANPFLKETDKDAFVRNMSSKTLQKPFNMDNIVRVNRKGEATALKMVSPQEALELVSKDPALKFLDVRTPAEYNELHIKDSLNIPLDAVTGRVDELAGSGAGYIVLCRTGNRSAMAADMLIQSGIKNVKLLDGGTDRWVREKLPLVMGKKTFSLERQVRMIAGSLVLTGIILARLIHPAFIVIPLFVSCGLIYAGATDNCMMGILLMKLPYNRELYKPKTAGGTCAMG